MKRLFNSHFHIGIVSLLGIIGIFLMRNMDSHRTVTRDGVAMDTVIRLTVSAAKSKTELECILDEAFEILADMEKDFSMYAPNSDISMINANSGVSPVPVNPNVYNALKTAFDVASLTYGAYDPTIGPVTSLWKRKTNEHSIPSNMEILDAASKVGYNDLILYDPNMAYLKTQEGALDLGGIGKGYASMEVKNLLISRGVTSALIDLGGNIVVFGGRPTDSKTTERKPWRIGIQDPSKPRGTALCTVDIYDGSIITAGVYERRREIDGHLYTHIFDPRRGRPIEGNLSSVTIISNDPTQADALSTALIVMGTDRSLDLLRILPGFDAVFISESGEGSYEILATGGLRDSLKTESSNSTVEFSDVI
ncbi:MAG: FAD:protein FMN transferase [Synergistaceae bacterium]|jgi:thiamine biosynthesis lipoprotein|nr:FAD:protein FMN transferase [Synergistaceae bacterium]